MRTGVPGSHIYCRFRDGDPHIYTDLGTGVPKIGGPQNFDTVKAEECKRTNG